jgi:transposase, IS5 family
MQDLGRKPKEVIVDLGFRGVDADNPGVEIIHRGKYKSLTTQQRKWLKRRQAIEPLIGHTKADHGMQRCWPKSSTGDALHAISCAAGYNIRWLLRAIARLGLGGFFYALLVLLVWGFTAIRVLLASQALWVPRSVLVGTNERQPLNQQVGAAG